MDIVSAALFSSAVIASFVGIPPGSDALGLEHEVGDLRTHLPELLGDVVLAVVFAYEVHEPAPASTRHLAADRAGALGGLVHGVDVRIGDFGGELLLVGPRLVQDLPGGAYVPALHGHGHVLGQGLRLIERLLVLPLVELADLALDDGRRLAAVAHVAEQGAVLELVHGVVAYPDAVDVDAVAVEFHQVEPAEDRRVLVLLPAFEADVLPLELVGQLGHLGAG